MNPKRDFLSIFLLASLLSLRILNPFLIFPALRAPPTPLSQSVAVSLPGLDPTVRSPWKDIPRNSRSSTMPVSWTMEYILGSLRLSKTRFMYMKRTHFSVLAPRWVTFSQPIGWRFLSILLYRAHTTLRFFRSALQFLPIPTPGLVMASLFGGKLIFFAVVTRYATVFPLLFISPAVVVMALVPNFLPYSVSDLVKTTLPVGERSPKFRTFFFHSLPFYP